MQQVIICKGLPASGKSTWAGELINKNSNYVRIEKDLIREMLFKDNWKPKKEKLILKTRDTLIQLYLSQGKSIIVSDTNLNPKHENRIRELVDEYNKKTNSSVSIEIKFFDVPLEECVKRDLKRLNSTGRDKIEEMYFTFIQPFTYEYNWKNRNTKLPDCIIVDLDGTLAINQMIAPYKYTRSFYNPTNEDVQKDINVFQLSNLLSEIIYEMDVIIVSGREDNCKEGTIQWLTDNNIDYHHLFMRKTGDSRPDTVIKKEIYDEQIKNKYNVYCAFDDRPSVINMWRSLGLYVFDCNQRGFRF